MSKVIGLSPGGKRLVAPKRKPCAIAMFRAPYRTIFDNCSELMLPLPEIRLFSRKGWIYHCRGCGGYHTGSTAAGVDVTLDMLANYRKLVK